jgi:hypothetical protein
LIFSVYSIRMILRYLVGTKKRAVGTGDLFLSLIYLKTRLNMAGNRLLVAIKLLRRSRWSSLFCASVSGPRLSTSRTHRWYTSALRPYETLPE